MLLSLAVQAAVPEIEDAPIDDADTKLPLPVETAPPSLSDYRLQTRLYTITTLDYTHVKSTASPIIVDNGLVYERSARQELNSEALYKPRARWTLKGDIQAQYSTTYANSTPLFDAGAQNWVKLNEAFVQFYASDAVSLLAGKYRRVFGPGIFQNPMDRHNPVSALPGQPLQREGAYLAQISWEHNFNRPAISDTNVSVGLLPRFYLTKYGLPAEKIDEIRFDETKPPNESIYKGTAQWSRSRAGGFLRLYGNVFNGDANLVAYYFDSQYQLGASYARYVVPWLELHAESLYYTDTHYTLLAGESAQNAYLDYLVGARIEYDQNIGLITEYLSQGEQPDDFPSDSALQRALIVRTLNPDNHRLFITPLQRYFLASLYARNIRDTYGITCNLIYGLAQQDVTASVRGDMNVSSHVKIALTTSVTGGSSSSFYGAAIPNDYRLSAELDVVF